MRKYGSDKPDLRNPIEMQAVTEHFAGSGFKVFAGMIANDPKVEVWAIPAKGGGSRAFCDRMNSWAQGEGQPGLGYIFWRKEGDATSKAPARSPRTSVRSAPKPSAPDGPGRWRRLLLRRRRPGQVRQVCRRRARAGRGRTEPGRRRPLRALLDRRFPVLRMGRGRQEGRLLAQPVLDAAGRHGSAREPGPADHQGLPVRPRLQRLRDRVRLDPEPVARTDGQGVREGRA
jgi:hypothetical protein